MNLMHYLNPYGYVVHTIHARVKMRNIVQDPLWNFFYRNECYIFFNLTLTHKSKSIQPIKYIELIVNFLDNQFDFSLKVCLFFFQNLIEIH